VYSGIGHHPGLFPVDVEMWRWSPVGITEDQIRISVPAKFGQMIGIDGNNPLDGVDRNIAEGNPLLGTFMVKSGTIVSGRLFTFCVIVFDLNLQIFGKCRPGWTSDLKRFIAFENLLWCAGKAALSSAFYGEGGIAAECALRYPDFHHAGQADGCLVFIHIYLSAEIVVIRIVFFCNLYRARR